MITDAIRKLDAFLARNPEFEAVNDRLNRTNLFRILRIEGVEIRHSNALAWLLAPGESHGLGDLFLRRFLSEVLLDNEVVDVGMSPAQVELMPLADIEVRREWRHIDVLVISHGGRWALLIENKIRAKEAVRQLRKYREAIADEMPDFKVIPVFLTLQGDDPSDDGATSGFVPFSHISVLKILDAVARRNESRIPADAAVILRHYMESLRRLTMQDSELIELCKTIYRRHRDALDLIMSYGATSQILDVCSETIPKLTKTEFVSQLTNRVWFLPTDLARCQPEICSGWTWLPRAFPIACWYLLRDYGKLQLSIEVGPIEDQAVRQRLMGLLREHGFKVPDKALSQVTKYTRILTKSRKLRVDEAGRPLEDPDYIESLTKLLWEDLWKQGGALVAILRRFDWGQK